MVAMTRLLRLLGGMSMYRQVTISLALIAGLTVALAAWPVGADEAALVGFLPSQLLASLGTLLAASLLANWIAGLITQTRPHHESALITGLLLYCIAFPTDELPSLLGLAVLAFIAVASKWAIAVGGRHLLNPAAAGMVAMSVVTSLTGWSTIDGPVRPTFGAWWIGSPVLLPGVAVLGGLLVWRLKAWWPAASYAIVAIATATVSIAQFEQPLPALWLALGSSPILFAAAFMITEPLTLPARHWQQAVVAAVAALVAFTPWSLGPFFASPELGIVVGNVLAFVLSPRRAMALRLERSQRLSPRNVELALTPLPSALGRPRFIGGSYLELHLPHRGTDFRGSRRAFSITSAADDPEVRVAVRVDERSSSFKRRLMALEPGTVLRATWVGGDFALPKGKVLLVAGGIGITPFLGQLADAASQREDLSRVTLMYRASVADQHVALDRLAAAGVRVILSGAPVDGALPEGWQHAGAERIQAAQLLELVPDLAERRALVAGPPAFIAAWRSMLRGMVRGRVRTDAFVGY